MWTIAPYTNHEDLYALQDNISKVRGNHLYKAGVYYSTNAKVEYNNGGNDRPAIPSSGGNVTVNTNNALTNVLIPGLNTPLDPTGVGQQFVTSENSVNGLAKIGWHDFEWYLGDTWKFSHNLTFSYGFRWSFYREPFATDNHYANFNLADWSASEAAANPSDACNGIVVVPGTSPCAAQAALLGTLGVTLPLSNGTPGPNRALVNNNNHNIAPRLGIAWDVRGDGKTAVRVGLGQFFQRELVGIDESLARNAPFVISANDKRTLETPSPLANPSVSPSAAKDPRAVVPNSWQWNLSVEQQLAAQHFTGSGICGKLRHPSYVDGGPEPHRPVQLDLWIVPLGEWFQRQRHQHRSPPSGFELRHDRGVRPWRAGNLSLAASSVPVASGQSLQLPGVLHLVALDWRCGRGQLFRQRKSGSVHQPGQYAPRQGQHQHQPAEHLRGQ